MSRTIFSENLCRARRERGLTQEKLADLARISRDTLSRYERGEVQPTIGPLADLVIALGNITADQLIFGESGENTATLGARLKQERTRLRYSQVAFAKLGGVCRTAQNNYETNKRVPDANYLVNIAGIGADIEFILDIQKCA